jgi:hypothetical protein
MRLPSLAQSIKSQVPPAEPVVYLWFIIILFENYSDYYPAIS